MKSKIKFFSGIIILISVIFVLTSCKSKKKTELESMRAETDTIRTLSEDFLSESTLLSYENWVEGKKLKLSPVYKKYASVFDVETIDLLNRLLNVEQRKGRVGKLYRLKTFVYNEIVNKNSIKQTEDAENMKSTGSVLVDSNYYPFYTMSHRLAKEPNPKKREKYYKAVAEFIEKVNPYYYKKIEKDKLIIDSLGFKNYFQFAEMIRELNFNQFADVVNGYLNSTNEVYFNLLNDILRQNKMTPENFFRYDTYKILYNEKYNKYFKKDSLLSFWKNTLAGMSIIPDSIPGLKLDMENNENKNPRAACFAVRIPSDIRMSVKPAGGAVDYSALFHESGHALNFALTTIPDFEYKYLNNSTITETYAFLFEYILDEPEFLKSVLQMPAPELKNYLKFRAFSRLYMTRRYCAKFLYELQLYDSLTVAPKKYSEILSSVLGYKEIPEDTHFYLHDVDDFFYVVDYLRAWFIEAMFTTVLRDEFGKEWYKNPAVGEYLKDFFSTGQSMTVEEFIQKIGFFDIDPKFLYNEIDSMLKFAKGK